MPCKTLPKLQPTNQKSEYLLESFEESENPLLYCKTGVSQPPRAMNNGNPVNAVCLQLVSQDHDSDIGHKYIYNDMLDYRH